MLRIGSKARRNIGRGDKELQRSGPKMLTKGSLLECMSRV